MRYAGGLLCIGMALTSSGASVSAQVSATQPRFSVGVGAGVYQTNDLGGSSGALGLSVGLERRMSPQFSMRTVVTAFRTTGRAGVLDCPPGYQSCHAGIFPEAVLNAELQGTVLPYKRVPVRLIGGAGITKSIGSEENLHGPAIDSSAGPRANFRAGLEVSLGRSRKAPRLSFTRSGYTKSIFSMNWLDALFISFPL